MNGPFQFWFNTCSSSLILFRMIIRSICLVGQWFSFWCKWFCSISLSFFILLADFWFCWLLSITIWLIQRSNLEIYLENKIWLISQLISRLGKSLFQTFFKMKIKLRMLKKKNSFIIIRWTFWTYNLK